jgi:hypothetical protein
MLDVWLAPAIIIGLAVIWGFYMVVRRKGGSGVRTDGKVVWDKPDEE